MISNGGTYIFGSMLLVLVAALKVIVVRGGSSGPSAGFKVVEAGLDEAEGDLVEGWPGGGGSQSKRGSLLASS